MWSNALVYSPYACDFIHSAELAEAGPVWQIRVLVQRCSRIEPSSKSWRGTANRSSAKWRQVNMRVWSLNPRKPLQRKEPALISMALQINPNLALPSSGNQNDRRTHTRQSAQQTFAWRMVLLDLLNLRDPFSCGRGCRLWGQTSFASTHVTPVLFWTPKRPPAAAGRAEPWQWWPP